MVLVTCAIFFNHAPTRQEGCIKVEDAKRNYNVVLPNTDPEFEMPVIL